MFCTQCGKVLSTGTTFCPYCGVKTQEKAIEDPLATSSSKLNFTALIGGALLVLSFFMPWLNLGFFSVAGYQLMQIGSGADKLLALLVWIIPIGGGIVAYFAYTRSAHIILASIATCGISILVWLWIFIRVGSEVNFGNIFQALSIGMYILLVGIACLVLTITDT